MIAVIQCAGTKQPAAGHIKSPAGKPVMFVADPKAAPHDDTFIFARPDDQSDYGVTWRRWLSDYNKRDRNCDGLYPAYLLYRNPIYRELEKEFGPRNLFILSAGWGLINAQFLTPYYDITFSPSAERYKRRRKTDRYDDFCMLPEDTEESIIFFGGKDYLPLFCEMTKSTKGKRTVYFNSTHVPVAPGCTLERYETSTLTNWHYGCAQHFLRTLRSGVA